MASPRKEKFPSNKMDNPEVLTLLINMFGDVLHAELIKSVALNCQWNLETASNILAELTSSVTNNRIMNPSESKTKKKNTQQHPNANSRSSQPSINTIGYAAGGDQNEDVDVLIEEETNIFSTVNTISYRQAFAEGTKKVVNTPKKNKPPPQQPQQQKSKRELEYERVVEHILTGAKVLVILRGLPGSGKTHLAKMIVKSTINDDDIHRFVYSTDEYFEKNGVYQYNPTLLQDAHAWNQRRVNEAMKLGISPVIVDNTNTETWEMKPYASFAVQFGYAIEILEPTTSWIFNVPELARRNCHGVPKDKIGNMNDRYEKNIKPTNLLKFANLTYKVNKLPPQPRLYPPFNRNVQPPRNIPTSILRLPSTQTKNQFPAPQNGLPAPKPPKKKRGKKKKNNNGQNSETSSTISKSESMHSILTNDSDDSDIDTLKDFVKTDTGYMFNVRDVLSDKPDVKKTNHVYDLLTPETSYNKTASHVETADLINFDVVDDTNKTAKNSDFFMKPAEKITSDLIDSCVRMFKNATTKDKNVNDASSSGLYPKLDLASWGLSEQALISWEMVDTPKVKVDASKNEPLPQRGVFRQSSNEMIRTKEAATNTSSEDFALFKPDAKIASDTKILRAINRDINENNTNNTQQKQYKVSMFDKSTMTGQEQILSAVLSRHRCGNEEQHFSSLVNLFPTVRRDVLKDILEKCQGDVNWAVDLLLDGTNKDLLTVENTPSEIHNDVSDCDCNYEATPPLNLQTQQPEVDYKKTPNKQKNKMSEESKQLKKQIEEQVRISDEFYSEHVSNLIKKRHGDYEAMPSTSRQDQFDNYEQYQNLIEDNESETSSEEELVEMNVGVNFIEQLERTIGSSELDYPKGFQPVVQLPVNLLRQLHAYWIESVYHQMETQQKILENMEHEDEEFARRLQEEEQKMSEHQIAAVPNMQEIMDMEIAMAIYKADTEQWKNETPDDLAFRMKKQKLYETFPAFDQATLIEILHSCGNSFDQTVAVLQANVEEGQNVNQTGNVKAKQKELFDNAKKEFCEVKNSDTTADDCQKISPEAIKKTATEYREEAQLHMEMREYNFKKAKEAMQKGQTQVALYYSEIARLHIKKYEHANSLAAVAFLASQTKDSKTLDLHFLLGKEAEQAMSVFIDEQISKLRSLNKPKDYCFIITGRGKHSKNGAVIKPIIMNKLKKRGLKFTQVNPGLLKVNINKNSLMTNDLNG